MKKTVLVLVLSLVTLVAFGMEVKAQIPKEGTESGTTAYSGTFKALTMGQERIEMAYEIMGVIIGDTPQTTLHNTSLRCVGALHAVKGEYDINSGFCVATRPDGDQEFWTYKTAGKLGSGSKGSFVIVGGTGKLTGIQGGGEFTEFVVRPAAEGTFQAYNRWKAHYKLP